MPEDRQIVDPKEGKMSRFIQNSNRPVAPEPKPVQPKPKPGKYTSEQLEGTKKIVSGTGGKY